MGPDVRLVDSGEETARAVERLLREHDMENTGQTPPTRSFIVSDSPGRFRDVGRRFIGDLLTEVHHVDIDSLAIHLQQLRPER